MMDVDQIVCEDVGLLGRVFDVPRAARPDTSPPGTLGSMMKYRHKERERETIYAIERDIYGYL